MALSTAAATSSCSVFVCATPGQGCIVITRYRWKDVQTRFLSFHRITRVAVLGASRRVYHLSANSLFNFHTPLHNERGGLTTTTNSGDLALHSSANSFVAEGSAERKKITHSSGIDVIVSTNYGAVICLCKN